MKRDQYPCLWQSRIIVLLVVLPVAFYVLLSVFSGGKPHVYALGISIAFALVVGLLRSATPAAALLGGLLTSSLIYSTAQSPFRWYATGLSPLLLLFLLTFLATRYKRNVKEKLSTAEPTSGRNAAQVAANLGAAAISALPLWGFHSDPLASRLSPGVSVGEIAMLACLAEATADTLSSELGQVLGGAPRLITNLRRVPAGTDGAISLAGSFAGIVGAAMVTSLGAYALGIQPPKALLAFSGGIIGLFFDSLLGATLEPRQWLGNDAVNFLSTVMAAGSALALCSAF